VYSDWALIIEGDSSLVVGISCKLLSIGHRFAVASTQAQAHLQLQKGRFDYILLDHCLPIFERLTPDPWAGLNLLKYIRRVGISTAALPVIIMSKCRGDMESGARFIKAGANECIPLPFRYAKESVGTKIEQVLKERNFGLVKEYKQQELQIPSLQPPPLPEITTSSQYFLEIDASQKLVFCQGEPIELQPRQFGLLVILAYSPHTFVRREKIFEALFGSPDSDEERRPYEGQIDNVKSQLIKAFKPILGEKKAGELIVTKAKVGFKLDVAKQDIKIIGEPQPPPPQNIATEHKMDMRAGLLQSLLPCCPQISPDLFVSRPEKPKI